MGARLGNGWKTLEDGKVCSTIGLVFSAHAWISIVVREQ